MEKTLAEIAEIVGGEIVGDRDLVITGLSGIKEAEDGCLTFLANPKYSFLLKETKASAILTLPDAVIPGKSIIRTKDPSAAFSTVLSLFHEQGSGPSFEGVHERAVIAEDVQLGKNVSIGPCVVIEKGARIGDQTVIYSNTFIGHDTVIGENCLIYPNVTIRERTTVGQRVIIHSGTVIGSDGFGFVSVDGVQQKIPQLGTVVIEDDVEIGANVTVDRARFDRTIIGRGTKIDNLVQIAHNVQIGEHCIIVSQAGISGSAVIEKGAVLGGQCGINGHITIGAGAMIAAQSGVTKSVPARERVSGYPAKAHGFAKRLNACIQRLPLYVKMIQDLKKRVKNLEDHPS